MMAIFYLQQLDPPLLLPISVFITSSEIQEGWHCGLNTDLHAVKPVSYTHLDVYKRQLE